MGLGVGIAPLPLVGLGDYSRRTTPSLRPVRESTRAVAVLSHRSAP